MVSYNITYDDKECKITDLKLSKEEQFVFPKQPEHITRLTIEDSTIPRLTEDFIGAFSNLEVLWAPSVEIEEVSEEAFVGCKNLKVIYFDNNQIKVLEPKTFNRNTKLEKLWLYDNQLDFLPKELFLNLKNLNSLSISYNNLTSLSKKLFTNLKNLESFYVSGNQLTDVKIEEIPYQCPKLKRFGIHDNDFSLAVLENIQKHLKDAGVNYSYKYSYTLRSRPYATQELDGVEYIPDEEYERLLVKNENSKLKKKNKLMEKKFELMQQKMEAIEFTLKQLQNNNGTEAKV